MHSPRAVSQVLDIGALPRLTLHGTESLERAHEAPFRQRWFFFVANVNAYPKLGREDLIKKYFDSAMHFLAPGYDNVLTISDLRDRHLLWAPHVGIGRTLSPRFAAFVQAGYAGGKVRTAADDRSWLLLPLHTDLEIRRGALYWGLGLDYFPFRMPVQRKYEDWGERLRAARPSLGARVTWTQASFAAKVKFGFKPFGNLVSVHLRDAWLIPSLNLNLGVDIPINRNSALTFNAGINYFASQKQDFDGTAFTIEWKRFF